ncbi:MAG: GNAT family N-acetyltransferase [Defluviitaleaceae bacterium]|nr:GNAT family N-acetyltransferase [Defluviitaleaceae bacterium]
MVKLETKRLILRPFDIADAESMYRNWASDPDVVRFMCYDVCDSLESTQRHIYQWMEYFNNLPIGSSWCVFAIELKSCGDLIGTIDFHENNCEAHAAEIGYQLGKAWWGNGYATEALSAVIDYCFEEVGLNRLWADHNALNIASGKVLIKAGMLCEGTSRQCYIREGILADKVSYAILKEDWDIKREIAFYNSLPCVFNGFIDVPTLAGVGLYLVCLEKQSGNPEKKYVPGYMFAICKEGEKIGNISLRIGYGGGFYGSNLYYGGQIGYDVDEAYRGNGYAGQACRLLLPVARVHKMKKLLITNDVNNIASRRVCEKLGARHVREVKLPEWTDMYKSGQRNSNIYEWTVE